MPFLSRKKQAPVAIQIPPSSSTTITTGANASNTGAKQGAQSNNQQQQAKDSINVTTVTLPPASSSSAKSSSGGYSEYGTYSPEEPVTPKKYSSESYAQQQQQHSPYRGHTPTNSAHHQQIYNSMLPPIYPATKPTPPRAPKTAADHAYQGGSPVYHRPPPSQQEPTAYTQRPAPLPPVKELLSYGQRPPQQNIVPRQPPQASSSSPSGARQQQALSSSQSSHFPTSSSSNSLGKSQQLAQAVTRQPVDHYRERQDSFDSLGSEEPTDAKPRSTSQEAYDDEDDQDMMHEDDDEAYSEHDQDDERDDGQPSELVQRATAPSAATASPSLSMASSMRKTSSRYTLADFHFMRTLGTGSFGRVHLVRSCHNSRFYAIKVLGKERVVRMKQVEHTNSERDMLERVRHPFLVNLWGTFKDSANLFMVMDFVSGGELFTLLRKSQRLPDPVAKFFAAEVALALDYLHSLDIVYRDLKPENILLAADGHIKITDFGFAKHVPDITWTLCGTPDYLAPEIVQSKAYNKSVDWYALGVLIFEMIAGYPPFFSEDPNPMKLYENIIAGRVRYPSYFTLEVKDLLKHLLTSDLTKRYGNLRSGSRDIFGHPWFAEVDWERLYRKEIPAPFVPKSQGDGDASCFEQYEEIDVMEEYGRTGADPHGHLFALF